MKYLILLLFLISCSVQDCRVGPNATVQTKTDSKTIDSKSESKGIADQIRDLRENLQPGAQLRCTTQLLLY
jgi:hypothetical protein